MKTKRLLLTLFLSLGLTLATLGALTISSVLADGFTVTKTDDTNDGTCDADCSLREAISAANANTEDNAITLPAGVYTLTLIGANEDDNATGDLDIRGSYALTITGAGAGQTIINANGIDRVFHLFTGTAVISGVTIYNGNVASDGGGVYNEDANLTLINTVVYSNATGNSGGGMYILSGDVSLTETQVYSNTAVNFGGGIYVSSGSAALAGTQVYRNSAGNNGGGLYVSSGSAVLMETQIYRNSAVNNGGGVLVNFGSASLAGMQVYSNVASFGGGVYVSFGNAVLTGTQVSSNTAGNSGGGVYVSSGSAALTGTHVYRNSAISGGGVFVASGSAALARIQVYRNTATTNGGGVYVSSGSASLTGTQVIRNSATANGGGLFLSSSGTITAANGCIVYNSSTAVVNNLGSGVLAASDNWWGARDGPSGEGAGNGDTVGTSVTYAPFKTTPPPGCPTWLTIYLPLVINQ